MIKAGGENQTNTVRNFYYIKSLLKQFNLEPELSQKSILTAVTIKLFL